MGYKLKEFIYILYFQGHTKKHNEWWLKRALDNIIKKLWFHKKIWNFNVFQ